MSKNNGFKVAALAASIALAMGSTAVMAAAPAAGQLPGQGKVVTATAPTVTITTATKTMAIDLAAATVINWGAGTGAESPSGNINSTGTAGFNVGTGATVNFTGLFPVLNIDSTGNASQIFGKVASVNNVFVANSNGIIVGSGGSISSTGVVGLIGNTTFATTPATAFDGTPGSVAYNGAGGDVTVQSGASLSGGTSVFISGGGNVNVDLGALTGGPVTLNAGVSNLASPATPNSGANVAITGGTLAGGSIAAINSAGTASNVATVDLSAATLNVKGVLTNSGDLTLGAANGKVDNQGKLTTAVAATFKSLNNGGEYNAAGITVDSGGDLTNGGSIKTAGAVVLDGGSLTNTGSIDGVTNVMVNDGYVENSGSIAGTGTVTITTQSDSADDAFAAGGQYYVNNSGVITSGGDLSIDVNVSRGADPSKNDSTGSFINTGKLQLGASGNLSGYAWNNLNLGGTLQADVSGTYKNVSKTNVLGGVDLNAGGNDGAGEFATAGMLTVATPVYFDGTTGTGYLYGPQVKVMSSVYGLDPADGSQAGTIYIDAGNALADDYAVRIAAGQTVSADDVEIEGYGSTDAPNVILQGTITGNYIWSQGSDLFSGPAGSIVATGANPYVGIYFTGAVKTAKYLNNANNFRYNYLTITNKSSDALELDLSPVAYNTNGTSNGKSAVNVLVDGDVSLDAPSFTWGSAPAPTVINDTGSAVTGVSNVPNTHLVLQSTGNIEVDSSFYWPGYVYLGTIDSNTDGSPAPGTLSADNAITLNGNFSNVLPGDVAGASGIHFMTAKPLDMAGPGVVTTNANALINFPTDLLTQNYAQGILTSPTFSGGTAAGLVVTYGTLGEEFFKTHPVDSSK